MKKFIWKVQDYWRSDPKEMSEHLNQMSREGWEVFKIAHTPDKAELSHYPTEQACLTDGDYFSIQSTTRIWYRK